MTPTPHACFADGWPRRWRGAAARLGVEPSVVARADVDDDDNDDDNNKLPENLVGTLQIRVKQDLIRFRALATTR